MSRYPVILTFFICIFIWPRCSLAYDPANHLNDDNWRDLLDGEWLVQFHAPWCPACRSLNKQWQTFAESATRIGIQVAKIDVTENPSLSGRFFVTALPTIFHVINGEFRQYRGPRDSQTLEEFVVEKKCKNVEVVPWYFYPDSYFMGATSYFFKLSHGLKITRSHQTQKQQPKTYLMMTKKQRKVQMFESEEREEQTKYYSATSLAVCNNGTVNQFKVALGRQFSNFSFNISFFIYMFPSDGPRLVTHFVI